MTDETDTQEESADDIEWAESEGDDIEWAEDPADVDDEPFPAPGEGADGGDPLAPADDESLDDVDETFDDMAVDDVEADEVWDEVTEEEEGDLATEEEGGELATEEQVAADERVAEDDIAEVSKHDYCESCEHFSRAPEIRCTHEGTEILDFSDMETVRLSNCPIVAERQGLEQGVSKGGTNLGEIQRDSGD